MEWRAHCHGVWGLWSTKEGTGGCDDWSQVIFWLCIGLLLWGYRCHFDSQDCCVCDSSGISHGIDFFLCHVFCWVARMSRLWGVGCLLDSMCWSTVENGGEWGWLSFLICLEGCCFVSMLVVVFFSFMVFVLYLCPYIHPKFPSIISDGRGYLGTIEYMGKVGLFCFLLFMCFSPYLMGVQG